MGKQDEAWNKVFECLPVLEALETQGFALLTADDLKRYGEREPRLMAKLDTLAERPSLFVEHRLALFPVQNGKYILFRDGDEKSYYSLGREWEDLLPETYFSQVDLTAFDTYPREQEFSESQALDFAYLASLLRTFCRDDTMRLTLRGRLFSGNFHFTLPDCGHRVDVSGVQIEVDAGYEGRDAIYLVEAKRGRRDNFHIRQLYYPYLNWKGKTAKQVIPIFFAYSNGQYYLAEFGFSERFGELRVVRKACYTVNDTPWLNLDLPSVLADTALESEPEVAFPQANDLDKVVDLVQMTAGGNISKREIAELFEFEVRQADYYANAAAYLGLLKRDAGGFTITETGETFRRLGLRAERTRFLVGRMAAIPSLRKALGLLRDRNFELARIGQDELAALIGHGIGLTSSTPLRRASTVRGWLAWVLRNSRIEGQNIAQLSFL